MSLPDCITETKRLRFVTRKNTEINPNSGGLLSAVKTSLKNRKDKNK